MIAVINENIVCRKTIQSETLKLHSTGVKRIYPERMNMQLNKKENDYYESTLKKKLSSAPAGTSFTPAWLFDKDPVSARMCRKFFEEVSAGLIPNIRKIGTRSQDGYTVI